MKSENNQNNSYVVTACKIHLSFSFRLRILTTAGFIMSIVMVCRQWPELMDWGRNIISQNVST